MRTDIMSIETISEADARMITAGEYDMMRQISHEDMHFGMLNGALDSIMREYPDAEVLYVYADGEVHVWDAR
jgi:hypothetical protein